MCREFQAPQKKDEIVEKQDSYMKERTVLKPLDQAVVTAITLLICGLLGWIAITSYQNSMSIKELNTKFESIKQDRDLSLIYIERRLGALEQGVTSLNDRIDGRDRR